MMEQIKSHWHYKYIGAAAAVTINGNTQYQDVCYISVLADTESEALEKVKGAVKREIYVPVEALECVEVHGMTTDILMTQVEIQKKTLDAMRGRKN